MKVKSNVKAGLKISVSTAAAAAAASQTTADVSIEL
jgi:hypothetical protein